jgi:GABA permease
MNSARRKQTVPLRKQVEISATALSRSLKPRHITLITLGGIIGAGLFVGSSAAIAAAGPAIVLSYAIAGIIVLLVMRMLGELAVAQPSIRSFTEFARAGLGNGAGFVAGWLYWYFWVVVIPIEAIAGATLLHGWIPLPLWEIGVGLMTLMTGVNLLSTRSYGEFEFWFASIKVGSIVVFIVIAASYAFGWTAPSGATFSHLWRHGGFAPHGVCAVLAGVVTVFFSINGAEIATVAAAESQEPARAIAQMTGSVVWRILVFYVGSISFIISIVPWDTIRPGDSPFTLALRQMQVPWGSTAMNSIILTAVLSCLNSAFYVSSRVLFVLAANGDAPQWLVKLNPRRVPARSVLVGGFVGVAGVTANVLSPQTVFAFLVNAAGAIILFVYITTALAQIRLRLDRQRTGRAEPALQMWGFPWLSWTAVVAMLAVLIAMMFTPALASQLYVSTLTLVLVVLSYFAVRYKRNKLQ